jgi:hypothetical protein
MRSRQVDKSVRVIAGMLAGITTARYLSPRADDKIYWNFVINEFDEFKFFSLQAHFLNGTLAEPEFRRQMADSPIWEVSAEYIIGLKHRLDGNAASAAVAFERCLKIEVDTESRNRYSPQQWAREDLKRLEQRKSR